MHCIALNTECSVFSLFWALIYNAAGIPIAAVGLLSPIFAAAAMALSSISVIANSSLLKRLKVIEKDEGGRVTNGMMI